MLTPSDLMVLGTRYYHGSSIQGLRSIQQQPRSPGFGKDSAGRRLDELNMQRVVSRHSALKLNQFLLVGLQPASSAESSYGWKSRNFALQTMDSSVRALIGNSARVLGSLPGGHIGGNSSYIVRISSSSVPRVRPAITRPAFRESRKLVTRRSRQQRSTSSRIGSTGDFSPQRLLECAVDVLRNFNEKVNSLFQQEGGGDSGSRDFTTAAEEKVLTHSGNVSREENGAPELVDVVSEQEQDREFEWRSALWEAEVSVVEELEAVSQREGMISSGGTDGDILQQVSGSNVPESVSSEAHKTEETKSAEISASSELQSPENSNVSSSVPGRAAQSSLEIEEREIIEQELKADSPSGLVSSLDTDEHTSSLLSVFDVPESTPLGEAPDVEIRADDKIEEVALTEEEMFANRALGHLENVIVASRVQQEVSYAEVEEKEIWSVVSPRGVTGLGTDGDFSQLGGSIDPEANAEIRVDKTIEEATKEETNNGQLERTENGNIGSTVQVNERAPSVETVVAAGEALGKADVKIGADDKSEQLMTEAITANRELEHPEHGEFDSAFQGSDGAAVAVREVDIGELWNSNSSEYSSLAGLALDSTEVGEVLSVQVVQEESDSLVGKRDETGNASEEGEIARNENSEDSSLAGLALDSTEVSEILSVEVVEKESESLVGKRDETGNVSEEVEVVDGLLDPDSLPPVSSETGEAVDSSSFGGQITLAGEAGAMDDVKKVLEFGEPFGEEQDIYDAEERNLGGMDDRPLQHEISRLRNSISRHAYLYHTLDNSIISDGAYDSLLKELVNLEAQVSNPESSLSVSLAAPPSPDMLKVVHAVPMLSLASVQKEEDVLLWYRKLQQKLGLDQNTSGWVVEPKVDGLALSLRYENSNLTRAATRGNGIEGEDVTHNAQRVMGIPLTVPQKLPGTETPLRVLEVRGEIFMTLGDFEELNASKIQAGEKPFANPRNAAAGSMRLLSSNSYELRPLSFMAYSIAVIEVGAEPAEEDKEKSSLVPTNQWEVLQLLKSAGFAVNDQDNRLFESFDAAVEYAKSWRSMRNSIEYEADGVVLKVNDLGIQASLGSAGADPRWALAWKFAATEAVSVLEGIELTIGRSGAMIPNARLKPVELGGTVISRASLHNFGHVKALGLCEGDHVVVQRAGDVIPQVVQVLEDLRPETATPWVPPQECPTCGTTLTEASASNMVFCSNTTCPSRHSRLLHLWQAMSEDKDVFRSLCKVGHFAKTLISGLGSATLSRLEEELVKTPADFYDLDEKALSKVKGFGKQSIKKLLKAIEESKQQHVWLFIAALGIPKVGLNTAKELAKKFGSLQYLLESDLSSFMDVPGIGAATASCIFDWCQAEYNVKLVHSLKEAGCKVDGNQVTETHRQPDSEEDGSINGASPDLTTESEGEPDVVEEDLKEDSETTVSAGESDLVEDLEEVMETDDLGETRGDLKKNDEHFEDVTLQPTRPLLSGMSIVITGDFGTIKREDMKKLVTLHGGLVRTSVTSRTSFVLYGNRPGPVKVAEASRRGVQMVDLQGFLSLIGQNESDTV